jgi:hypothetical protein
MISFNDLHDATFTKMELDWAKGEVEYRFETSIPGHPIVQLVASGVIDVHCPRRFPWGESVSVNEIRVEAVDGGTRLTVEMQSGDLIEANVTDVHFQ